MLKDRNLKRNVPLAPYTTYQIGGKADYFLEVQNKIELAQAIGEARAAKIPFFLLGTGANILFGDKGFRGLVILNHAKGFMFEKNILVAESGAVVGELLLACARRGLSGLEHFIGIPSSVGGAIYQNLHFLSPDRQRTLFIEEVVRGGLVLERGLEKSVDRDYFSFGYDDSILHHDKDIFVLEITFYLETKDQRLITNQMRANQEWRNAKQPQLSDFPSCGSVFKKIRDVGAGRLIDECGLKGFSIGGAKISEKHANYIVNTGGARASDVRAVISFVQNKVLEKTGFELEPEIGFIGEF